MACNEDLKKENRPYPRTCADCGLGPCKKYPETNILPSNKPTPPNDWPDHAWVLWFKFLDGSGSHIQRAYTDEKRANEDFELLRSDPRGSEEWILSKVPIYR